MTNKQKEDIYAVLFILAMMAFATADSWFPY